MRRIKDSKPLNTCLGEIIDEWIETIFKSSKLANLCHFYKYADLNDLCRNITSSVTVPKTDAIDKHDSTDIQDIYVWDKDDVKKIIDSLNGSTLRFLIVLTVDNGILYIRKQLTEVRDVRTGKRGIRKVDVKTTSSRREIPLSSGALKELEIHRTLHKSDK